LDTITGRYKLMDNTCETSNRLHPASYYFMPYEHLTDHLEGLSNVNCEKWWFVHFDYAIVIQLLFDNTLK